MGNSADKGFSKSPQMYLREIRKETNRHLKYIATVKKRRSSSFTSSIIIKKEEETAITEMGKLVKVIDKFL